MLLQHKRILKMARQALKHLLAPMIGYRKMLLHSHLKMDAERTQELAQLIIVYWYFLNSAHTSSLEN